MVWLPSSNLQTDQNGEQYKIINSIILIHLTDDTLPIHKHIDLWFKIALITKWWYNHQFNTGVKLEEIIHCIVFYIHSIYKILLCVVGWGYQLNTATTIDVLITGRTMSCHLLSTLIRRMRYISLLTVSHILTQDCRTTWRIWISGSCLSTGESCSAILWYVLLLMHNILLFIHVSRAVSVRGRGWESTKNA